MPLKRTWVGIAVVLCLSESATATMYMINNPAETISNPADKMYNPATRVDNPGAAMYNSATRMNDPNPLSPPTMTVTQQMATEVTTSTRPVKTIGKQSQYRPVIPHKNYHFKSARAYRNAAKKAFVNDDFIGFITISEDALRRMKSGTLVASRRIMLTFDTYKRFGYSLLRDMQVE